MTDGYKIKRVYLGGPKTIVVSDMQGPCDDGFHVPSLTELNNLLNVLKQFGWISEPTGNYDYNVNNFSSISQYLLAPSAGDVWYNGSYVSRTNQITWLSSIKGSSTQVYTLYISSSYIYINKIGSYSAFPSLGRSIRPYKNTPVVPDSSWTKTYSGTGDAGVYHNSDLGLLSISSDGTNWITIADKNLGATSTDITSSDSYGNYYQWGNNYGFQSSGFTTSSTAVNASTYGPGNYYNSSTFITGDYWDSSNNTNLRGGVSLGTSTKTVYNKIRPKE